MNNIEKKIKSELSNFQDHNNDPTESELWQSIEESLNIDEPSKWRVSILGIFLIGFVAIIFYTALNTNSSSSKQTQIIKKSNVLLESAEKNSSIGSKEVNKVNTIDLIDNNKSLKNDNSELSFLNEVPNQESLDFSDNMVFTSNDFNFIKENRQKKQVHQDEAFLTQQNDSSIYLSDALTHSSLPIVKSIVHSISTLPPIEKLSINLISNTSPYKITMNSEMTIPSKIVHSPLFELSLFNGVNQLFLNQNNSIDNVHNSAIDQANSLSNGLSVGIGFSLVTKKNIFFDIGIEYHELYSKFSIRDTTYEDRLVENYNTKVWVDANTGSILKMETNDVIVEDTIIHRLVQHNHFSSYALPISAGFRIQKDFLAVDFSLGVSYVMTKRHQGVSLSDQISVSKYDTQNFHSVGIGLDCEFLVSVSENIFLSINPRWRYLSPIGFHSDSFNTSAQQVNLNFGVGYKFN